MSTVQDTYDLPLPRLRGLDAQWYGWLKQHQLRFQRCTDCLRWRHVPREVCPGCGSTEWTWQPSTGRGTIYTWTTTHRSLHPAFVDTPYAQVVVELDEGPRVMTWIVDLTPRCVADRPAGRGGLRRRDTSGDPGQVPAGDRLNPGDPRSITC